jgi:hypothetical protein
VGSAVRARWPCWSDWDVAWLHWLISVRTLVAAAAAVARNPSRDAAAQG